MVCTGKDMESNQKMDILRRYLKRHIFMDRTILEHGEDGDSIMTNYKPLFFFQECVTYNIISMSPIPPTTDVLIIWKYGNIDIIKRNQIHCTNISYIIIEHSTDDYMDSIHCLLDNNFTNRYIGEEDIKYRIYWKKDATHPLRYRKDRIAMYFSGRINTYEQQLEYLTKLIDKYDIDCFVSINGQCDEYHNTFSVRTHACVTSYEPHEERFVQSWYNKFRKPDFYTDHHTYKLSSATYNNYVCIQLIDKFQTKYGFQYDVVIKFRADISTNEMLEIPDDIYQSTVYIPQEGDWNIDPHPGINDQFAYGSFHTMYTYSTVYPNIEQYCDIETCAYHPETLLMYHLNRNNVKIIRFPFDYGLHCNRHSN